MPGPSLSTATQISASGRRRSSGIGDKKLDEITTDNVLGVLKPIWLTKPETASRLRGRIERVLDAAKAKGLRHGENPARWRGHLDHLLPKRQKLSRGHHAAMPYKDVPAFLERLRGLGGLSALALEFCILGAARSGEVFGAKWDEIDLDRKVWTVPAERMKSGREHRVPLTDRILAIIETVEPLRRTEHGDFIFPGQKRGRPLSSMALEMQLRRMKIENSTVHGFRSSFRDWAGEETHFPREMAEAALAHVVGDNTERAYRRGDALERRRELMEAWMRYCAGEPAGEVVRLAEYRAAG
jgi:integrase